MLLAIDMGNTCITLGVYAGEQLKVVARLATDHERTSDQYAIELRDVLGIHGIRPDDLDGAILCSVVPVLTDDICRAVRQITGLETMVLGPGVKTGLNIRLDNPAQLGSDLVAGAVAAIARFPAALHHLRPRHRHHHQRHQRERGISGRHYHCWHRHLARCAGNAHLAASLHRA